MIRHERLSAVPRAEHGFFTRAGGVSIGLYGTLNCGFGSADQPRLIAENRSRCAARLGVAADRLVTAHQVHGATVAEVSAPWEREDAPRADGMVTQCPGLALGVLTADCAPILLADGEAGIIGAAHAGWKGARAGVAEAVVAAMVRLGGAPGRIVAVVGPTIGAASYEVGPDFQQAFLCDDPSAARFFKDGPIGLPGGSAGGPPYFDLQGFVAARLSALGLAAVGRVEADTCADADRFFSYRRSCLNGEPDYGRQLSAIVLR
jgi:YfiH family protein